MGEIIVSAMAYLLYGDCEKWLVLTFTFGKFGSVPDKMPRNVDFSWIAAIVDHIRLLLCE